MLAHHLRRWATISPVLGYPDVFGATRVGQRHRRRTNITPALVHEVVTRAEWILASTGDARLTFNRHWVGVGL